MSTNLSPIAHARPAAVDDHRLATLRRLAHDAPRALASDAECEWLLSTVGPLLDELALRRAWMAGHAAGADLSNIVILPAVRA